MQYGLVRLLCDLYFRLNFEVDVLMSSYVSIRLVETNTMVPIILLTFGTTKGILDFIFAKTAFLTFDNICSLNY